MLNVGIVGLPNVGKSSLFNALTAAGAPSENYPFCTVEPNVGTVEVPDDRLERIHALSESADRTPTFIHFVDIAGLVEGASEGEGLGNQFLGQIREVHAIAHVLRCFEDADVAHVSGSVDPVRDKEVVETELALADLATVERRLERVEKKARSGERDAQKELAVLRKVHGVLAEGRPVRVLDLGEVEERWIRGLHLLTSKPVLYVANVGEEDLPSGENEHVRALKEAVADEDAEVVAVCTRIEAELAELERLAIALDGALGVLELHVADLRQAGAQGDPGLDRALRSHGPRGRRPDPHGLRAGLHPRRDHLLRGPDGGGKHEGGPRGGAHPRRGA